MKLRERLRVGALVSIVFGFALDAQGQSTVALAPDVTVTLDGLGFADQVVAVDNLLGITVPTTLGALPESAEVTAYHELSNGDRLFALDTTAELAGPLTAFPTDVIRYDGIGYAYEFRGVMEGVPDGARVDAVSRTAGGDLLLSFDTTVELGGVTAADEDLVLWDGASFSLLFDGSLLGLPPGLDLDAGFYGGNGLLALSFDASGSIGGVDFADEDVLYFNPSGPTWGKLYDGSAQHPELAPADLQAVMLPEPGQVLMLASGLGLLLGLRRRSS